MKPTISVIGFITSIALSVLGDQEVCEFTEVGVKICGESGIITRVTHPENRDYIVLELGSNTTIRPNAFRNLNTWELRFVFPKEDPLLVLSIQPGAFAGIEYITNLDIHYANVIYSGNPWSDIARIKAFSCECCGFTQIPNDILSSLPNLRKLTLDNNRLEVFRENAFTPLKELQTLRLLESEQIILDQGCFKGLEKLKELDISAKSLTLRSGAFDGLGHLETLKMTGRLERGLHFLDSGLSDVQSLRVLQLSASNISHIPRNVFQNFTSLGYLVLSDNPLVTIEPGAFSGMNLSALEISFTVLEDIKTGMFKDLTVDLLLLTNCNISVLEPRAFSGLNVSWIALDYNQLTRIGREDFSGLNVEGLILAKNNLTEIAPDAFKNATIKQLILPPNLKTSERTLWGLPDSVIITYDDFPDME